MLGTLSKGQIDNILHGQVIGRIGCYADGKVYVVPVSYAYDGKYIYAHSGEGMKIRMMRKNPYVCFEVDAMENMANWRSVVVWGKYEELRSQAKQLQGMQILVDRLMPFTASETAKSHALSHAPEVVVKGFKAIVYRIKVKTYSGRFEKAA